MQKNPNLRILNKLKSSLILHDEQEVKEKIYSFKHEDTDIAFVFNMLLTGFDLPNLKRLYIHRELKDHNLLQALARVNRPYNNMSFGYLIDFIGIQENFDKTTDDYLKELNRFNQSGVNSDSNIKDIFADREVLEKDIKNAYDDLLSYLFEKHFNDSDLHLKLDIIFNRISSNNAELFNTISTDETTIALFESISQYINEESKRANFTRALLDKLKNFDFKQAFLNLQNQQGYDFFAPIFEYLLKDYNSDKGGKYAEYYTPLSIASIIAKLLINEPTKNVKIYDPSAGTGTLLMALAHQIGTNSCTLYAQDISQKSLKMLKLNLILNDLTHSLKYAIEGNTLTNPYHSKECKGKMDYIVSNPPFKLDFSNEHAEISQNKNDFFLGVPNIPKNDKSKMPVYTLFFQHCLNMLKDNGKGAIVVPTGFISAKSGIENKIVRHLVDERLVYGVVCMRSQVFANTGTNVSIIFFKKTPSANEVILIDASKLGEEYTENKNKKTRLRESDIDLILKTFQNKTQKADFCALVSFDEIIEKNYSLNPGQYFTIEDTSEKISQAEFEHLMQKYSSELTSLFDESQSLQQEILETLGNLNYD
ncbi:hypothetical protein VN0645_08430 [Helicobacter pylori]|nr:hypothetical protein VN0645_08430 [Helicobacter pylori]